MANQHSAKASVTERYPNALCIGEDASYGIGSVKVYAVWTAGNGRVIGRGLSANEAWRKAASLTSEA